LLACCLKDLNYLIIVSSIISKIKLSITNLAMKKLLMNISLFLVVVLIGFACDPDKISLLDYVITEPDDVTLTQGQKDTVDIGTRLVFGQAEEMTLSLSGLPDGVTGSFDTVTATLPFSSHLALSASSTAKEGTYPLLLKGLSAKTSKVKEVNFNLIIVASTAKKSGIYEALAINKN
jgi:hypothetical protein